MTTLLVTSDKQVYSSDYRIATKINFRGMKLRSASILNNQYNVVGHVMTYNFLSIDIPLTIADGNYEGADYAAYLERRLNSFGSGADTWKVSFNEASLKFSFRHQNDSPNAKTLSFNGPGKTFIGTGDPLVFPGNKTTYLEAVNQTTVQPGYYRVTSQTLTSHGYTYDDSPNSNVVGVIPINAPYGKYSTFSNTDSFYQMQLNSTDIQNFLDVKVYLENQHTPLENPVFALVFQFIE